MSYSMQSFHSFVEKNKKTISCEIKKTDLDLIIPIILEETKLNVFGYDKSKEEYWGKLYKKDFSFTLKVEDGQITVYAVFDSDHYINIFCKKIKEFLDLCDYIP